MTEQNKAEIPQGNLELFKKVWYSRNPVHETNADTGEDMFWQTALLVAQEYAMAAVGGQRFKMPTDQQVIKMALVFNDGRLDPSELTNMVSMCQFVVDRLYENGDIMIKSSKEEKQNDNTRHKK